jgi:hypothetical protein
MERGGEAMSTKKKAAGALPAGLDAIIKKAVEAALQAGRAAQRAESLEPYKQTERRLYALPHLEEKIAADKENLEFYTQSGEGFTFHQGTSKSIVRFERTGYRVSQEDIREAMIKDLESRIAADEEEVQVVRAALRAIEADYYFPAVEGKYLLGKDDDNIGEDLACDASTVRRNRGRLVRIVAIRLYGIIAI